MTPKETPMMRQFNEIKRQHTDKILFFRMGDFYEMFGEDAVKAAKTLQIQLTSRNKNKEGALPMCGIPYHAYEQYLDRLTKAGLKVAICEQMEDPSKAIGIVKRAVVRVVTPGTSVSERLMQAGENSYIAAIYIQLKNKNLALAFCDISTGEFEVEEFDMDDGIQQILELLYLYKPKELLFHQSKNQKETELQQNLIAQVKISLNVPETSNFTEFLDPYQFDFDRCKKDLQIQFQTQSLSGFGIENKKYAICAAGSLLNYLKATQRNSLQHLVTLRTIPRKECMILDESTIRNLELFESSSSSSSKNTLIYILDKTQTPMGLRLLRKWIGSPLLKIEKIIERQDAVQVLIERMDITSQLRQHFKLIGDLERIISRISLPIVTIYDFVRLRTSLLDLPKIAVFLQTLDSKLIQENYQDFDSLKDVYAILDRSFQESPANKLKEGGFIRDGFDSKLDELRNLSKNAKQLLANLELKEKESTGISSLKIKFNRVFGYYIEITNTSKHLVPEHYTRKQTLSNAERFITEDLKELEESILSAEDEANFLEMEIFDQIYQQIQKYIHRIYTTAKVISTMDALMSFAWIAQDQNFCRPDLFEDGSFEIQGGRHPVIEAIQDDEPFIPNDLLLHEAGKRIMLITGPNMGGKSTYMRQVALISLLAQIGSFIPATGGKLKLFDRIFTRVGASDNLTRGQSTFMVEMNEAASILNNATENSLIILDEIGRGTSTFDGISIAWAMVEHIHEIGAITLFATHYHELTLLEEELEGVINYNVAVKEEKEKIIFLRKIVEGKSGKSYGIQVARLAGLPKKVIQRANLVLKDLEDKEEKFAKAESISVKEKQEEYMVQDEEQMSYFQYEDPFKKEIEDYDLMNASPMDAMQFLHELQKKVKC